MKARRKVRLLAASVVTLPLLAWGVSNAASTMVGGQRGPVLMAAPVSQSPNEAAAIVARLADARDKYGLDADHGFRLTVQHPGGAGTKISRFAHTFKGVRVFQSESVVVTDDAGNIVSESASDRRNGLGRGSAAAMTVGSRFANFDVTPALSAQGAVDAVLRNVAQATAHSAAPQAELVIYPVVQRVRVPAAVHKREWQLNATDLVDQVTGYELAYLVQLRLVQGEDEGPLFRDAIVSANDGRVIEQWDGLQTVTGVGKSQYNGEVPISTTLTGSVYSMRDPLRGVGGTFGSNAVTNANLGTTAGLVYSSYSNVWGDGRNYISGYSTTGANGQTAAVNAMWGLMNTYDTLKNVLGWHSLDGNNTATYIAAHVFKNYDNAFYNDSCRCMFIGDGGSRFYSLGAIDIIGHEMGHGVTAATSNLIYRGESGGLNESASDINGEMVEAYARAGGTGSAIPATGNDWLIGAEIGRRAPLRWMAKPSKDGRSPDAWTSTTANLDVHYSSGPNNRMFYFLSQGSSADSTSENYSPYLTKWPRGMTGIGNDKAYRIWFRALTTKFTSSTNYADARDKVIAAARELYGIGSREAIAVQRAYAAINVGADIDEPLAGGALAFVSQPQNTTADPGSRVTFAVEVRGGTPPYRYQWMRGGALIAGATAASYTFTAQRTDNEVPFSVRVSDSALPPSTLASRAAIVAVSSSAPIDRVTNGGFEQGATGWTATAGVINSAASAGQVAYDGQNIAYLGGNGRISTESLSQTVSIPPNAGTAQLKFALHVQTNEMTKLRVHDKLTVAVKNPAGVVLATLGTFSNLDSANGYQLRAFDLLPYKGQTITVVFTATEDISQQTSFSVDAVSVVTQ